MNKREIKKILSDCAFDPNDPKMKIILDVGKGDYFLIRARELISESLIDGNVVLLKRAVGLIAASLLEKQHGNDQPNRVSSRRKKPAGEASTPEASPEVSDAGEQSPANIVLDFQRFLLKEKLTPEVTETLDYVNEQITRGIPNLDYFWRLVPKHLYDSYFASKALSERLDSALNELNEYKEKNGIKDGDPYRLSLKKKYHQLQQDYITKLKQEANDAAVKALDYATTTHKFDQNDHVRIDLVQRAILAEAKYKEALEKTRNNQ